MSTAREALKDILEGAECISVAPIFDPLSARMADMRGWKVIKLSGSVGKHASLAVPDGLPMSNHTDLAEICSRITRVASSPLIVDADDGGAALTLMRLIRELEHAGVAGIELEDNMVPTHAVADRHSLMVSKDEHVARLKAAVAAKTDPTTVIFGRTAALNSMPLEEALDRIGAYAKTGVDAIMLPGLGIHGLSPHPKSDLEAVQSVANLPLCVSGLEQDLIDDTEWMQANRITLRFNVQAPFRRTVQAIHDGLAQLEENSRATDGWAAADLVKEVIRNDELQKWDEEHGW